MKENTYYKFVSLEGKLEGICDLLSLLHEGGTTIDIEAVSVTISDIVDEMREVREKEGKMQISGIQKRSGR